MWHKLSFFSFPAVTNERQRAPKGPSQERKSTSLTCICMTNSFLMRPDCHEAGKIGQFIPHNYFPQTPGTSVGTLLKQRPFKSARLLKINLYNSTLAHLNINAQTYKCDAE